jgi:hypothetical protein
MALLRLVLATIYFLLTLPAMAQEQPVISIMRTAADADARLAPGEPFWIEVAYRSDVPLRLQAAARTRSADPGSVEKRNATYPTPPGEGRSLVWLALSGTGMVDGIEITAYNTGFQPLATLQLEARPRWVEGVARRPTPDWAATYLADQAAAAQADFVAAGQPDWTDVLLGWAIALGIPLYLVLQWLALRSLAGGWRMAAWVPALLMGAAGIHAALALAGGSNLWPILLIFAAPPAVAFLLALLLAASVVRLARS